MAYILCSIKPVHSLALCQTTAYFYSPEAVEFLMHYRVSLHIYRRTMLRTRGKSTPISNLRILPGRALKLRIISWFKKLYIYVHIRTYTKELKTCIYFPLKTNGKRCQSSYASAFVAVHFTHRWEHVTISHDDILRHVDISRSSAGQKPLGLLMSPWNRAESRQVSYPSLSLALNLSEILQCCESWNDRDGAA